MHSGPLPVQRSILAWKKIQIDTFPKTAHRPERQDTKWLKTEHQSRNEHQFNGFCYCIFLYINRCSHVRNTELNNWLPVNSWVWIWIGHNTHGAELRWQEEGFTEQRNSKHNRTTKQVRTANIPGDLFNISVYLVCCFMLFGSVLKTLGKLEQRFLHCRSLKT